MEHVALFSLCLYPRNRQGDEHAPIVDGKMLSLILALLIEHLMLIFNVEVFEKKMILVLL